MSRCREHDNGTAELAGGSETSGPNAVCDSSAVVFDNDEHVEHDAPAEPHTNKPLTLSWRLRDHME